MQEIEIKNKKQLGVVLRAIKVAGIPEESYKINEPLIGSPVIMVDDKYFEKMEAVIKKILDKIAKLNNGIIEAENAAETPDEKKE